MTEAQTKEPIKKDKRVKVSIGSAEIIDHKIFNPISNPETNPSKICRLPYVAFTYKLNYNILFHLFELVYSTNLSVTLSIPTHKSLTAKYESTAFFNFESI
ncbi:hypothetical protein B14911_16825 [Bacillus sp. NRRL B-14911]|nr:hypothetical protein B14911_16825 [Bacillus sp. NRRL B-14911]